MNPGLNTEPFELFFEENYFKKDDWMNPRNPYRTTPWYIRMWGFKYVFQVQVLDEPKQEGIYYRYPVQYKKRMVYWFNIKVKEYE